jgi:hypothetical protein
MATLILKNGQTRTSIFAHLTERRTHDWAVVHGIGTCFRGCREKNRIATGCDVGEAQWNTVNSTKVI